MIRVVIDISLGLRLPNSADNTKHSRYSGEVWVLLKLFESDSYQNLFYLRKITLKLKTKRCLEANLELHRDNPKKKFVQDRKNKD